MILQIQTKKTLFRKIPDKSAIDFIINNRDQLHIGSLPAKRGDLAGTFVLKLLG